MRVGRLYNREVEQDCLNGLAWLAASLGATWKAVNTGSSLVGAGLCTLRLLSSHDKQPSTPEQHAFAHPWNWRCHLNYDS